MTICFVNTRFTSCETNYHNYIFWVAIKLHAHRPSTLGPSHHTD